MNQLIAVCRHTRIKAYPENAQFEYEIMPIAEALMRDYPTDAHLVTYVLPTLGRMQPRLLKSSNGRLGEHVAMTHVMFADVDNPGHAPWGPDWLERVAEIPIESEGYYLTEHGYRLMQPLDSPVPSAEVEPFIASWYDSLESRGIQVDRACQDWTRHFRLPSVVRSRRT